MTYQVTTVTASGAISDLSQAYNPVGWGLTPQNANSAEAINQCGTELPRVVDNNVEFVFIGTMYATSSAFEDFERVILKGEHPNGFPNDVACFITDAVLGTLSIASIPSTWTITYNKELDVTILDGPGRTAGSAGGYQVGEDYTVTLGGGNDDVNAKTNTSYSELVTAISDWLKRKNISNANAYEFIRMGEEMLRDGVDYTTPKGKHLSIALRVREMRESKIYAPGMDGTDAANSDTAIRQVNLPDDYLEMIDVFHGDQELKRTSKRVAQEMRLKQATVPTHYAVKDGLIIFAPMPQQVKNVTVTYYADFGQVSKGDSGYNPVLSNYYNCYLYACLMAAEMWLFNDKRSPMWERRCVSAVRAANQRAVREERSGHRKEMRAMF